MLIFRIPESIIVFPFSPNPKIANFMLSEVNDDGTRCARYCIGKTKDALRWESIALSIVSDKASLICFIWLLPIFIGVDDLNTATLDNDST